MGSVSFFLLRALGLLIAIYLLNDFAHKPTSLLDPTESLPSEHSNTPHTNTPDNEAQQAQTHSDGHDHPNSSETVSEENSTQNSETSNQTQPKENIVKPMMIDFSTGKSYECKFTLILLAQPKLDPIFKSLFSHNKCITLDELSLESQSTKNYLTTSGPLLVAFEQDGKVSQQLSDFLKKLVDKRGGELTVFNFWKELSAKAYEKEGSVKFELIPYSVEGAKKILEIEENRVLDKIEKALTRYNYKKVIPEKKTMKFNLQGILGFDKNGENYEVRFLMDVGQPLTAEVLVNGVLATKFSSGEVGVIKVGLEDEVRWRCGFLDNWSQYTLSYKFKYLLR